MGGFPSAPMIRTLSLLLLLFWKDGASSDGGHTWQREEDSDDNEILVHFPKENYVQEKTFFVSATEPLASTLLVTEPPKVRIRPSDPQGISASSRHKIEERIIVQSTRPTSQSTPKSNTSRVIADSIGQAMISTLAPSLEESSWSTQESLSSETTDRIVKIHHEGTSGATEPTSISPVHSSLSHNAS